MKHKNILLLVLAIITGALFTVAFIFPLRNSGNVISGWGDNGGGRQSYTYEEINKLQLEDKWNNKIVFNSISNSPMGNEKNFVGAREYSDPSLTGTENTWNANKIDVKDGQEYIVRAYVHNNKRAV